ncbi:MAG: hypothetical protein LLG40_06750 [Deltaproteobacteria bacterium]|nr:hypothetical protein [Deltaproteobacteria bacterium]
MDENIEITHNQPPTKPASYDNGNLSLSDITAALGRIDKENYVEPPKMPEIIIEEKGQVQEPVIIRPETQVATTATPEPAKEINKFEEYEKRIAELESKISDAKKDGKEEIKSIAPRTISEKVKNAESFDELKKIVDEVREARKNIRMHLGKDLVEIDGREFTRDQITAALNECEDVLERGVGERLNFLKSSIAAEAKAKETFPEMYKAGSEAQNWTNSVKQSAIYGPVLKNIPDANYLLGLLWRGYQSMNKPVEPTPEVKPVEENPQEVKLPEAKQQVEPPRSRAPNFSAVKLPGSEVSSPFSMGGTTQQAQSQYKIQGNLTKDDIIEGLMKRQQK